MSVKPKLVTAEQLFEMGSDARYELVRGELREMTPAGFEHCKIAGRLAGPLGVYVQQNNLGEVLVAEPGFVLQKDPDIVRSPDVAFVAKARIPEAADQPKFAKLAPDLAVEVVSPNDRAEDVDEKIQQYLDAGAKLVWVIHPRTKTVVEYASPDRIRKLTQDEALEGGDVIPGFSTPVSSLFS